MDISHDHNERMCDTCRLSREESNRQSLMVYKSNLHMLTSDIQNKSSFRRNVMLFLNFLDSCPGIKEFLNYDCYFRLADKYLIAMVFIYFQRAGIRPRSYTRLHFFAALCLAHSMEEEDKDLLGEIFPWALGVCRLIELAPFLLQMKLCLWKAIDYRAFVNKYCCQKVMAIWPHHYVWKRKRTRTSVRADSSIPYFRHTHTSRH